MSQIQIPKEWELKTLDEICNVIYRYPTYYGIKYQDSGVPEIRGKLILNNGTITKNKDLFRYISKETSERFPQTILEEGDIVMMVRASMGKCGVVPKWLSGANITANLIRISVDRHICVPEYLNYFFGSGLFLKPFESHTTQATIKTIKASKIKELEIPLPDLKTQKKIVEKLNLISGKVEEKKKQILQKMNEFDSKKIYQTYKNYLLRLAFTGELSGDKLDDYRENEIHVPKGWELKTLGENDVSEIIMGQSPPSSSYNKQKIGLPFFQGKKDFGDKHPSPTTWCSSPKKIAKTNDILICVRAPVGPTNLAKETCCIGRGLAAIRPKINLYYVYYFLKWIEPKISKSGEGMVFNSIGRDFLHDTKIIVPSLKTQKKIVEILDSKFKEWNVYNISIKNVEKQYKQTKKSIEYLPKSILNSAFSGKLVN